MRLICLLGFIAGSAASVVSVRAADVTFERVWPGWRDAAAFERIKEYFGAPEHHQTIVVRTHAEDRGGYYFLVRVKANAPVEGSHFELNVIRPDAPEPKTFTFPTPLPPKESVVQLGLTGPDWPEGKQSHPVAWRLALVGADGHVLAEQKSFLWDKPAK